MPDRLISTTDDMIAVWRERIRELDISHQTVDALAGWADGYCSKLMCGLKRPGPLAIALMNGALAMGFRPVIDEAQAELVRDRWIKRSPQGCRGGSHLSALNRPEAKCCDASVRTTGVCPWQRKVR